MTTPTLDEERVAPRGRSAAERAEHRQRTRVVVRGICAAAAVASLVSSAAPTGLLVVDRLWCAVFAAGTAYVASRASRTSLVWMAGLTAVASVGGLGIVPALGAMACVFVAAAALRRRRRVARAGAGALAAIALLVLPDIALSGADFHGAATLVAVAAVLPLLPSSYRRSPKSVRRTGRRVLGWGLLVLVVVCGAAAVSAAMAAPSLVRGGDNARVGLEAAGQGAQSGAAGKFTRATDEFDRAAGLLDGVWALPARAVPVLSQHMRAMSTAAAAGSDLSSAAEEATTVAPYEELTADQGRVDVASIALMQEPVREASTALDRAADDLRGVQSPWLLAPAADAIAEVSDDVDDAQPEVELAADALEVAPGLLGADGDRSYLLLFTTPSETRNLGGFVGAYAVLDARGGDVDLTTSGQISDLLDLTDARQITGQDEFLNRYGRYRPTRYFQNVTVSPDMGVTAEVARDLYEQTTGQVVDGVVVADPFALQGLLRLTGPVTAEGIDFPIDADNVIPFLLVDQYQLFDQQSDRKDRLQDVGRATFDALTERTLPKPAALGAVLGPVVDQKHLLFHPFDETEQAFIEEVGALGDFSQPARSDLLSVRMANRLANKIDVYVHRTVDYDVAYDPETGWVEGTVEVRVRNDVPEGLPSYVVGDAGDRVPPGTARMLTAVYSPLNAVGATLDGLPIGIEPQVEAGANVYTTSITLAPGQEATFVLELSGTIEGMGDTYRLLTSPQPLANPDRLTVTVHGFEDGATVSSSRGAEVAGGQARRDDDWLVDEQLRVRFR